MTVFGGNQKGISGILKTVHHRFPSALDIEEFTQVDSPAAAAAPHGALLLVVFC